GFVELSQSDARKAERLLNEYREIYIGAGASVMVNSPNGIQAKTVVFKTPKAPSILPPEGSIASDLRRRNYVKHLIDRYHEFASEQRGRSFSYSAIYSEIKKK